MFFCMKALDGSHERAMLAWASSWISDRQERMSKKDDSPVYEFAWQLRERQRRVVTGFHM